MSGAKPDDPVDKLAYAVGLLDGASRIASTAHGQDISVIGIPFYLLIGFSIENGLKAVLQFQKCQGNWKNSHDLADLLSKTVGLEERLWPGTGDTIRNLSRYHKEFWFRYPTKAVTLANVYRAETALIATNHFLSTIDFNTGASHST